MLCQEDFKGRMDDCREMFKNQEAWKKLPLLNSTSEHLLHEGMLVRFEGMIQDMFNPTMYLSEYEVKNTRTGETQVRRGEFHDEELGEDEVLLFDSKKTILKDRKPYYCVSTPGINEWVEECHQIQQFAVLEHIRSPKSIEVFENNENKRCCCDNQEIGDGPNKRLCCNNRAIIKECSTESKDGSGLGSQLPIENSKGIACVVYVYNEEPYPLNTIVEVAGFLSYAATKTVDAFDEEENFTPSSLIVPHLHAVAVNKLKCSNPLISPSTNLDEIAKCAESTRAELNIILRLVMFDDGLTADYLLCYLLSSVFSRQNELALGKFSLNISNIPKGCDYVKQLYNFLSNLVPKSHYLPLTIENLNNMSFVPIRNYSTNKLQSGLLQLSDNTFLVLDETKLQPGKLEDKGVKNLQALSRVIRCQDAHYDFRFYPLEFFTDIPVLTLSEGKSMLPSDFHIKLSIKTNYTDDSVKESFHKANEYLKDSDINKFRIYLSAMASLVYKLSEDIEAQIAEDFVRMRQNIGTTTPQDLHDLLVLARLFSISRGCTSLTTETWAIVQEMERQRKG